MWHFCVFSSIIVCRYNLRIEEKWIKDDRWERADDCYFVCIFHSIIQPTNNHPDNVDDDEQVNKHMKVLKKLSSHSIFKALFLN